MKILRHPTDSEQHAYMRMRQRQKRMRQRQNLFSCQNSKAEAWMKEKLEAAGGKWTRQAQWGYRLFDFWNHEKGIAVEVDGQEHEHAYDAYRDSYNYARSGIVVLRVRNFSEPDAVAALTRIAAEVTWSERRTALGLVGPGKRKARRDWESGQQSFCTP